MRQYQDCLLYTSLEALSYRDDTVPETAAAKAACGAPNLSK